MTDHPASGEPLKEDEQRFAGMLGAWDDENPLPYIMQARATPPALDAVFHALADEDEIAHGEAWDGERNVGIGFCAYCDDEWPCRTQRGIDRLLARLTEQPGADS